MNYKEILTEKDGYVILDEIIPSVVLDGFQSKLDTLHPVRASASNKMYAERDDIGKLPDISVWWSQLVMDYPEVIIINNLIKKHIDMFMSDSVWYASDTVFINPKSEWVNPHVDTPHRFEKWAHDHNLLGLQCIVPLYDLNMDNGATGLVPKSQKKNFAIDMCYKGYYNGYFSRNYVQPSVKRGSVLMYNCRVLHSSMPNPTNQQRPAILFNYIDGSIIDELRTVDNIWNSNG